jgi:multidrug efflux pump subunit AcrA (membrane-fusion protein)
VKLPLYKIAQGVVPVLVLIGSVLGARALIASKPEPQKKPVEQLATLVEVQVVAPGRAAVQVRAQGTVTAVRALSLAAEVAGRITWRHPQLTTGGLIGAGEVLLKIDPSDYKLALAQEQANTERARTDLELELGRRAVAEREWQMFGAQGQPGQPTQPAPSQGQTSLALRDPQLRNAKLGVESAESGLEKARLLLGRTAVRAPFNAVVRSSEAETGRLVTPGQALAELVATDAFVVAVSLPVGELAWLRVPGMNVPPLSDEVIAKAWASTDPVAAFAELGTPAIVRQQAGDGHIVRNGLVTRLLGDLDPVGRMARVLVGIDDPFGRKQPHPDGAAGVQGLPILLGAYVSVELEGQALDGVIELPRLALRDGGSVFLMDADDRLATRQVEVLRRQADHVLIGKGLAAGDRVIVSPMPTAIQGMRLQLAGGLAEAAPVNKSP